LIKTASNRMTSSSNHHRGIRPNRGMNPKAKTPTLVMTNVANTGSTSTPQRLTAKVAIPDSITNAQKATTQKAIHDCGSKIAGFAWRPKGTSNRNKIAKRSFKGLASSHRRGRVVICLHGARINGLHLAPSCRRFHFDPGSVYGALQA